MTNIKRNHDGSLSGIVQFFPAYPEAQALQERLLKSGYIEISITSISNGFLVTAKPTQPTRSTRRQPITEASVPSTSAGEHHAA